MLYYLIHAKDCGGCDRPAVIFTERPQSGEILSHEIIRHLDGSPAVAAERPECGSCHGAIMEKNLVSFWLWEIEEWKQRFPDRIPA